MPISIDGAGTITGISAGGLPDACVTAADLASGAARSNFGAGAALQVVQTVVTSAASYASTSFVDLGVLSASITPASSSNKILVLAVVNSGCQTNGFLRLQRSSSNIHLGDSYLSTVSTSAADVYNAASSIQTGRTIICLDSPGSTTSVTYKIQGATYNASYPLYFNMSYGGANNAYAVRSPSSITLMEIAS
jgi:hypothetical protein